MRTSISSIFFVTVLTLAFQSTAYAKKNKDLVNNELRTNQSLTTLKPTSLSRVIGRNDDDEMMMNMSGSVGHGNNGKDNALDNVFKIFMMCQTFISTALMLLDPIFKVKNFVISLITTFITVAKFIMDLKKSKEEKKEAWGVGNMLMGGEDRIGMSYGNVYRPTYFAHYPTYMHTNKYRVHS